MGGRVATLGDRTNCIRRDRRVALSAADRTCRRWRGRLARCSGRARHLVSDIRHGHLASVRGRRGRRACELLSPTTAPTWIAILRGGSNGPSIAILCAGVGLIGAALLPRVERVGTGPVVTGALTALSLLSLALCWLALTAGFAVHYVRMDMRHDGLRFPGTDHPTFGDYVYFSVAVATTFGATDVAVVHPRLRRVVTGHGVLAFVFNTVVLALVVNVVSH